MNIYSSAAGSHTPRFGSGRDLGRSLGLALLAGLLVACNPFEEVKDRLISSSESDSQQEQPVADGPSQPAEDPNEQPSGNEPPSQPAPSEPDVPAGPAALIFESQDMPLAIEGADYSAQVRVSGGIPPYFYTFESGKLPSGFAFDSNTGQVSGNTSALGTYTLRTSVRDSSPEPVEISADVQINVTSPPTNIVEVPNGNAAAAAAGIGIEPGLLVTFARGGELLTSTDIDWQNIDYGMLFRTTSINAPLDTYAFDYVKFADGQLPRGRGPEALWYTAMELSGWVWVEKEGVLRLQLTDVNNVGRLQFDGEQIALVTTGQKQSAVIEIADVKRGFHRLRFVHINVRYDSRFKLQMAEGGSTALAPIAADRLFHGPTTIEQPLLSKTAFTDFPFSHQLRAVGIDSGAQYAVALGSLPGGLSLSSSGKITGTPTEAGTHYFTIRVTNGTGISTLRNHALHVLPAPPTGSRNDADSLLIDFESASPEGTGFGLEGNVPTGTYAHRAVNLTGTPYFLRTRWLLAAGVPVESSAMRLDPTAGVLDGNGSAYVQTEDFGFFFTARQADHFSDHFPAARTANRIGVYFQMPDSAVSGKGVAVSQSADPDLFRTHALATLHTAGHNTTRYARHAKEMRNWHFYHQIKYNWPGHWKASTLRYVGDRWWYYEICDQPATQRTGLGKRSGFYNPQEEVERDYVETLSRFYCNNISTKGTTVNTYPDGSEFRLDKIHFFRVEPKVRVLGRNGERVIKRIVSATTTTIDVPFKVELGAGKAMRLKIARPGRSAPSFDGTGIYLDTNANGFIDAGETELDGEIFTPQFTAGETKHFVYRIDMSRTAVDTTNTQGVSFRVKDRSDVLSLDGDSIHILVYKASNPNSISVDNILVGAAPASVPSPTAPANQTPVVNISKSSTTASVGEPVTFEGSWTDTDGPYGAKPYWDFGDDTPFDFNQSTSHTFKHPGVYKVRLYACDMIARGYAEVTVTVTD